MQISQDMGGEPNIARQSDRLQPEFCRCAIAIDMHMGWFVGLMAISQTHMGAY